MTLRTIQQCDITNKRVLIRVDFNVPISNGHVANDARLRAAIPTIEYALAHHAKIILLSHLGRPTEGECHPEDSLAPVATRLAELLQKPVRLQQDWLNGFAINSGEIVLCENVRCLPGESANDVGLAKRIAALGDVFVMDAFATAHRKQASTYGVAEQIAVACAGPLVIQEINALDTAIKNPHHPVLAIIGGAKVSNKLSTLRSLAQKVDNLIVGGGIANTFLAASGFPIGKSLVELDLQPVAKELLTSLTARGASCLLPIDVIVTDRIAADAQPVIKFCSDVSASDIIVDIGPETIAQYIPLIQQAGTIIWSGPLGIFEIDAFSAGTCAIAKAIAVSRAFSLAGGGDTINAIDTFGVRDDIAYISTGGGAFLEYIEGTKLPAITVLQH